MVSNSIAIWIFFTLFDNDNDYNSDANINTNTRPECVGIYSYITKTLPLKAALAEGKKSLSSVDEGHRRLYRDC